MSYIQIQADRILLDPLDSLKAPIFGCRGVFWRNHLI